MKDTGSEYKGDIDNVDDEDDQHLFKAGSLVKGFLFCLVSRLEWEIECNGNFFHCWYILVHPSLFDFEPF